MDDSHQLPKRTVVPLAVTRSDGKAWTTQEINDNKAPNAVAVGEPVGESDKGFVHWQATLGMMLKAQLCQDATDEKLYIAEIPMNYAMRGRQYAYNDTKRSAGRTDVYLYGHPRNPNECFRSPNEFAPHLLWLSSNSDDRAQCSCEPCKKMMKEHDKTSKPKPPAIPAKRPEQPPGGPGPGGLGGGPPTPPGLSSGAALMGSPAPPAASAPASNYGVAMSPATAAATVAATQPRVATFTGSSDVFRQGEMVWYKATAWRLGVIGLIQRDAAAPTDDAATKYLILPLGHATLAQQNVVKRQEDMRPFLTFSVPATTIPELDEKAFAQVDWPAFMASWAGADARKREFVGLEASKMAARMVDTSFSLFSRLQESQQQQQQQQAPAAAADGTSYGGVFLGAEQLCLGDAVRVKDTATSTTDGGGTAPVSSQYMEIVRIVPEQTTTPAGPSGVTLYGDIYTLVLLPASDPTGPQPHSATLREELEYRDAADRSSPNRPAGSRWAWRLVSQNAARRESDVLGRLYPTPKLMAIINPAKLREAAATGAAESAASYLNNRMHGGGGAGPGGERYVGRRANRRATLGLAVGSHLVMGEGVVEEQ